MSFAGASGKLDFLISFRVPPSFSPCNHSINEQSVMWSINQSINQSISQSRRVPINHRRGGPSENRQHKTMNFNSRNCYSPSFRRLTYPGVSNSIGRLPVSTFPTSGKAENPLAPSHQNCPLCGNKERLRVS